MPRIRFFFNPNEVFKVNIINSFIGFEHETAGNLLISISACLWASKKEKRVCGRKNH